MRLFSFENDLEYFFSFSELIELNLGRQMVSTSFQNEKEKNIIKIQLDNLEQISLSPNENNLQVLLYLCFSKQFLYILLIIQFESGFEENGKISINKSNIAEMVSNEAVTIVIQYLDVYLQNIPNFSK